MTVARHTKHSSDTRATGSVVGLILIAALIAALVIGVGGWMYAHNGLGIGLTGNSVGIVVNGVIETRTTPCA